MLAHLRISVPDRPGMLARISGVLADAGADIRTISVLERRAGRAIDDVYVNWPEPKPLPLLAEQVATVGGVRLLGVRRSREVPGAFPDIDLLTQVLATASRGIDTLVDMAAFAFGGDWAASVSYATGQPAVLYCAAASDDAVVIPDAAVRRPAITEIDGVQLAVTPLEPFDAVLVCGRAGHPAFHHVELERIRRVTELAVGLVRAELGTVAAS